MSPAKNSIKEVGPIVPALILGVPVPGVPEEHCTAITKGKRPGPAMLWSKEVRQAAVHLVHLLPNEGHCRVSLTWLRCLPCWASWVEEEISAGAEAYLLSHPLHAQPACRGTVQETEGQGD